MINWNENLTKAPEGEPILVKVNKGLFSGGWQFYKALRVNNSFFNADTKEKIEDPHSWSKVNL